MASNDETGRTVEAADGSSSHRGSAVTSTKAGAGSSGGSPDPDRLVREIEATREDLAETLDAIVDKVSPKRVMDRTKEQARSDAQDALQTVKESAASAAQSVKVAAANAAETVKEQVASARESVKEKVGGGSESDTTALSAGVTASAASSRRLSGPASAGSAAEDQPLPGSTLAGGPALSGSPLPAETVSLNAYDVGSAPDDTTSDTYGKQVVPTAFPSPGLPPAVSLKAPLLAGAGAAVAVLLLILRRRRR